MVQKCKIASRILMESYNVFTMDPPQWWKNNCHPFAYDYRSPEGWWLKKFFIVEQKLLNEKSIEWQRKGNYPSWLKEWREEEVWSRVPTGNRKRKSICDSFACQRWTYNYT